MKVKELIELLGQFNPDADVVLVSHTNGVTDMDDAAGISLNGDAVQIWSVAFDQLLSAPPGPETVEGARAMFEAIDESKSTDEWLGSNVINIRDEDKS